MRSKEYYLIKQGLRELEADKKKGSKVESFNALNPYLLPLFSFFNFNPSFLILPDIISNNILIPFL